MSPDTARNSELEYAVKMDYEQVKVQNSQDKSKKSSDEEEMTAPNFS